MTEFTSADLLCSSRADRALERLQVYRGELNRRPLIAQIWGANPLTIGRAARLCADLGFAGIDINMGCPVRKISKKGACSALIRFPSLAKELIHAARENSQGLPVSVKTRIGWDEPETETWCGQLLEQNLDVLTIHGRTVAQKSEGKADWAEIAKVVKLRNSMKIPTQIIGNGDATRENLERHFSESGVDGIMVGRAIFQDLGLFSKRDYHPFLDWSESIKIELLQRHIRDHWDTWRGCKDYEKLKKFFKNYTQGFEGALDLRARLMETHDHETSLEVLNRWTSKSRKS